MKCSVIIPFSHHKDLLIKSLTHLAQCCFDFEIIIVEDGETSLGESELDELNIVVPLVLLPSKTPVRQGAARARNRGIAQAQGEILIFLDCDMLVQPDFVEAHYHLHAITPPGSSILQIGLRNLLFDREYPDTLTNLGDLKCHVEYELEERHDLFEKVSGNIGALRSCWYFVYSNNLSVPRDAVAQYGGFDEGFAGWGLEDTEFGYRLFSNGLNVVLNPAIEAFHQFHNSEFSLDKLELWNANLKVFMNKYPDDFPVQLLRMIPESDIKYGNLNNITDKEFRNINCDAYTNFESCLRLVYDKFKEPYTRTKVLDNPTIQTLEEKLALFPNTQYKIYCPQSNAELILYIQLRPYSTQLLLFTHHEVLVT